MRLGGAGGVSAAGWAAMCTVWLACAPKHAAIDASLPDGDTVAVGAPREALAALAASADPTVRGAALAATLASADPAELDRWALRAAHDPAPGVALRAMEALSWRADGLGALRAVAALDTPDPYVRAAALRALHAAGAGHPVPDGDGLPPWEALPLWVHALDHGADVARVAAAVRAGHLRDDAGHLAALGGHPEAAEAARQLALREGDEWGMAAGLVAALGGAASLTAVVAGDPDRAEEVVDRLSVMGAAPNLRVPAGGAATVRRAARALAAKPDASLARAVRDPSPLVRVVALRRAAVLRDVAAVAGGLASEDVETLTAALAAAARLRAPALADALRVHHDDDRAVVRAWALGAWLACTAGP
jgi:hypothetical protein